MTTPPPVLDIRNLSVRFGAATALESLSLDIAPAETLALIGESGSGKSVLALIIMGLLRGGTISSGEILLRTQGTTTDLTRLTPRAFRRLRGNRLAIIFQEPMSALNPILKISTQLGECLALHRPDLSTRRARHEEAEHLLARTGIPDPAGALRSFPHQLSGGMRQRVMIAMALSTNPALLIADEPTTALDAATRMRILDLIRTMAAERGTATLFITHDFSSASAIADRIAVLYAGHLLETGPTSSVFTQPAHPYTRGLIASLPDPAALHPDTAGRLRLRDMPGAIPGLTEREAGCVFSPRCPLAIPACHVPPVPVLHLARNRDVACLRPSSEGI
ncbi:ABC transporter ATP-binding protein [Gluconobacter morbifer]|uniref:ABC transporter domain-containing protein n=1 Tax=Gluconobacter morbifer G707 TaxID=1088869 RepID=G6XEW6_9PROT|nr:ABC transporter ATP-binding protein [Gluconobacter morbifer]EHH68724.1 hypothetical protein GMO_00310 [Gluconobacter morbifer G707]